MQMIGNIYNKHIINCFQLLFFQCHIQVNYAIFAVAIKKQMSNSKSITYQNLVCIYDMTFAEPQNPCSSESLKSPDWWDSTGQWLNNSTVRWGGKLWTMCWLLSIFLESTINFILQNWLPISCHITKFQR